MSQQPLTQNQPSVIVLKYWNYSLKVFCYVLVTHPGITSVHCFWSQSLDTYLYASVTSLAEYNETTILITNTQQGHNTNDYLEVSNKPDIQRSK